jgi:hypothetical protein
MSSYSGEQTVILTTVWCWQNRDRLAVSKQTVLSFHMEKFNLRKFNEVEDKEQYHVKISNRFARFQNLDAEVDINRGWEIIRI